MRQHIRLLRDGLLGRAIGLFGALPIPPSVETFAGLCGATAGAVRAAYQRALLESNLAERYLR